VKITLFLSIAATAFLQGKSYVLILVDDLGYMDLGAYNPKSFYETPNIDRLAKSGLNLPMAMPQTRSAHLPDSESKPAVTPPARIAPISSVVDVVGNSHAPRFTIASTTMKQPSPKPLKKKVTQLSLPGNGTWVPPKNSGPPSKDTMSMREVSKRVALMVERNTFLLMAIPV